jgi:hypothetical protein
MPAAGRMPSSASGRPSPPSRCAAALRIAAGAAKASTKIQSPTGGPSRNSTSAPMPIAPTAAPAPKPMPARKSGSGASQKKAGPSG